MNTLMKIGAIVFAFALVSSIFSSLKGNRQVSTDVIALEFASGLDLAAVSEMAKDCQDAADLENKLNLAATGINNLDLDDDGKVDFIKVTEYGDTNERNFSLTTDLQSGETQEIATITVKKEGDRATMQTRGHHSLYGSNHYHHSSFGLGDALLFSYLFSNHRNYSSPWGYGNHPDGYQSWNRRGNAEYRTSVSGQVGQSTFSKSSSPVTTPIHSSPNANKQAAKARILSNPKQSQQSFAKRTGRPISSGGFGRSSSGSSSRSSSGGGK